MCQRVDAFDLKVRARVKEEQRGVGVKGAVSMRRRINVRRRRSLRANLSEWLEKEDMFLVRQSLVRARTVQSRVDEQRELASTEQWLRGPCAPVLARACPRSLFFNGKALRADNLPFLRVHSLCDFPLPRPV